MERVAVPDSDRRESDQLLDIKIYQLRSESLRLGHAELERVYFKLFGLELSSFKELQLCFSDEP